MDTKKYIYDRKDWTLKLNLSQPKDRALHTALSRYAADKRMKKPAVIREACMWLVKQEKYLDDLIMEALK